MIASHIDFQNKSNIFSTVERFNEPLDCICDVFSIFSVTAFTPLPDKEKIKLRRKHKTFERLFHLLWLYFLEYGSVNAFMTYKNRLFNTKRSFFAVFLIFPVNNSIYK